MLVYRKLYFSHSTGLSESKPLNLIPYILESILSSQNVRFHFSGLSALVVWESVFLSVTVVSFSRQTILTLHSNKLKKSRD